MIERYSLPEIKSIWEDENRFKIWLEIEILACEARAKLGEIPEAVVKDIREKADFNTQRILEIEKTVKHDVIAFLTNVAEYVGENARYIHYGMTSSDILDTALAVQMKQAGELILKKLEEFKEIMGRKALEHKQTLMIGRTHGIHAEPITFGFKLAIYYEEIKRNIERLQNAIRNISVGQISGAVGTYDYLSPDVEAYVCEKLGLQPAPDSNQVIQRDRHAEYMNSLALIGALLEKIAVEIRHLQRTEVLEAEENFSKGQKGSSAMPHKKNPIVSERLTGMARLLRSNAHAAMENIALWHERDISHSSVERIIIPDSTMLTYYMLSKACDLIENLRVHPDNMMKNLQKTGGLIFSQSILLALTEKQVSREKAYAMVQRNALKVWEGEGYLPDLLKKDQEVLEYISPDEIDSICALENKCRNMDEIFKRIGLE
ncbi:MAG: adenylosuccinate lyase [Calditrichia bacterium]